MSESSPTSTMVFGELRFPAGHVAAWRGLPFEAGPSGWPAFFGDEPRTGTVDEALSACGELNDVPGPSFFFLAEAPDRVRLRAWLEPEDFERWAKPLAAAVEATSAIGASGQVFFVAEASRHGVRLVLGEGDRPRFEEIKLTGADEEAHVKDIEGVFELSRAKMFGPSVVLLAAAPIRDTIIEVKEPLLEGLEFVADDLYVSYRASTRAQDLDVQVLVPRASKTRGLGAQLAQFVDGINRGAAGGKHFAPSLGAAEILERRRTTSSEGTRHQFTIHVASMSPLALRSLVELLSRVAPVTQMAINGSLPLDDSELSVREEDLRPWFSDRAAYPGEWPAPGFVLRETTEAALAFRVELERPLSTAHRAALRELVRSFLQQIAHYASEPGCDAPPAGSSAPTLVLKPREVLGELCAFPWVRAPARALFVNMLARFHETRAPIVAVELALGGPARVIDARARARRPKP